MVSLKVFCVRIGTKYGPEYEDYINRKLEGHTVHWIREPYHKWIPLQWNKLKVFDMDIDEPVIVMDIDKLLIHDYEQVINYPCKKGQFVSIPYWWNFNGTPFRMSGGFYKFWPKENRNIWSTFEENIPHWTSHYIKSGLTIGPVNGEFMYVQEHLQTELALMPDAWFTRWVSDPDISTDKIEDKYREITGNVLYDGHDFHEDVKMVHFTRSTNKPHNWKNYDRFN